MKFEKVKIEELKEATYNPRKDLQPSDAEYQKIKKSIEEFGYVEPIIVNKDNTIIGGHQRLKVLKDLGFKEIDIVRIDIDKTKEKALNIALNKITGDWDYDKLGDILEELKLDDFDIDITGFDDHEIQEALDLVKDNPYTFKVDTPQYDVKGELYSAIELIDEQKSEELIQEIESSNIPEDIKEFLIKSAYRHNKFNYSRIAEFYTFQNKEVQELMERSALVVIDIEDAIKNGYAQLRKYIIEDRDNEG